MINVEFGIFDEVFFLNTVEGRIESARVASVQVIPTAVSADENGEEVCDAYAVLYKTKAGMVLSGAEVFADEAACREHYLGLLAG